MSNSITRAVAQLLEVVRRLHRTFPKKRFTLDGRLLGDIGEVLVESEYAVELYGHQRKHHDADSKDGRPIQIKATMKNSLTFPADHVPKYFMGIKIDADGSFTEVFNGPGRIAAKAVKGRKRPKTNLHCVSISALQKLSGTVAPRFRIPRRRK